MSMTAEKIVSEALALSPQARAFVAERLIESLDMHPVLRLSPAWQKELDRRCRQIDAGEVELREAEDVFARSFAALG